MAFSLDSGAVNWPEAEGLADPPRAINTRRQRVRVRTLRGLGVHRIGSDVADLATFGPVCRRDGQRGSGACFPGFFDPLRQFARIRPYVETGTPVRIVRRGDLRAEIRTGPGVMEEPADTGLTHVRNVARLRLLPLLTAVRTARTIAGHFFASSLWHRPETKFARDRIRPRDIAEA